METNQKEEEITSAWVLPEACTSNVLMLTTPFDACRLSLVAKSFQSAAESDSVWERFLPSDCQDMIAQSINGSPLPACSSMKELYFHLCDHPLIIDGGMKSFSLDRWSGKKCYMLAARDLRINWGELDDYWHWISLPESRFNEVAELRDVWWLEIRGTIDTRCLSPNTTYETHLVFKFRTYNAFGFAEPPAEVAVGITGERSEIGYVCLDPDRKLDPDGQAAGAYQHWNRQMPQPRESDVRRPNEREDGWLEVKLGEFFNNGEDGGELEMSIMEAKGVRKSGLLVEGIEIKPKKVI